MREKLPVLHRYEEEEEEEEGREVKEKGCFGGTKKPTKRGGTSERERETILSIKAAFSTPKGGFFFCNSVSYFG